MRGMKQVQTIRGRLIGTEQVAKIQEVIQRNLGHSRCWISREICRKWGWIQANGRFKEVACRDLLVRLEKQGQIQLPARRSEGTNHKRSGDWVSDTRRSGIYEPAGFTEEALEGQLRDVSRGKAQLQLMLSRAERKFWNTLIHRYHYLGYHCTVGPSLKYLIYLNGRVVGCIGWAAGLWKLGLRDNYIGWEPTGQQKGLNSIINNVRFLILPWVKIRYLASHVLSVSASCVKRDWERIYQTPAYLLESLVDKRFQGTCYKAAGWVYLGQTKGMSKRGLSFYYHGRPKDVYVYPLVKDFRERLKGEV